MYNLDCYAFFSLAFCESHWTVPSSGSSKKSTIIMKMEKNENV